MDPNKRRTLSRIAAMPAFLGGLTAVPTSKASETNELREVSDIKKAEVQKGILAFKDGVPDEEEEQLRLIWDIANQVHKRNIDAIEKIDAGEIETEVIIADSTLGVLRNIYGNINEAYGISLPIKYLEGASRLTKFVPLLSTTQNFIEVCERISERASRSADFIAKMSRQEGMHPLIEDFYIAVMLVLVEFALLPASVGYRPAFTGTRYVANYGLVRLRRVVGLRGYSVLLSVVHWIQRGSIEGAISYIVSKSGTIVRELDEKNGLEVDSVSESDLDYEFLREEQDSWWPDFFQDDNDDPFKPLEEEISQHEQLWKDGTNSRLGGAWNPITEE